jgi:hypothetical protein
MMGKTTLAWADRKASVGIFIQVYHPNSALQSCMAAPYHTTTELSQVDALEDLKPEQMDRPSTVYGYNTVAGLRQPCHRHQETPH